MGRFALVLKKTFYMEGTQENFNQFCKEVKEILCQKDQQTNQSEE